MADRWEHFSHRSDIGLRAVADNKADVFEEIACAMATRKLLFSEFDVQLDDHRLHGLARGESVSQQKHQPAVEIKGATFTALEVKQMENGQWQAQCVVDV